MSEVSGTHSQNKTIENVRSFGVGNRIMHFMPNGLEKFFTNLILLDIYSTGLLEINKEDLEPFPDLNFLSLTNNELQTIDFDLFVYNPNLEMVLLWGNKIETVNDAFYILPKLRYLSFRNNSCYSGDAKNNQNKITALIKEIHKNCEPDYEKSFEQCKRVLKIIQNKKSKSNNLNIGNPLQNIGQTSFSYNSELNAIYTLLVTLIVNHLIF